MFLNPICQWQTVIFVSILFLLARWSVYIVTRITTSPADRHSRDSTVIVCMACACIPFTCKRSCWKLLRTCVPRGIFVRTPSMKITNESGNIPSSKPSSFGWYVEALIAALPSKMCRYLSFETDTAILAEVLSATIVSSWVWSALQAVPKASTAVRVNTSLNAPKWGVIFSSSYVITAIMGYPTCATATTNASAGRLPPIGF